MLTERDKACIGRVFASVKDASNSGFIPCTTLVACLLMNEEQRGYLQALVDKETNPSKQE